MRPARPRNQRGRAVGCTVASGAPVMPRTKAPGNTSRGPSYVVERPAVEDAPRMNSAGAAAAGGRGARKGWEVTATSRGRSVWPARKVAAGAGGSRQNRTALWLPGTGAAGGACPLVSRCGSGAGHRFRVRDRGTVPHRPLVLLLRQCGTSTVGQAAPTAVTPNLRFRPDHRGSRARSCGPLDRVAGPAPGAPPLSFWHAQVIMAGEHRRLREPPATGASAVSAGGA